MIIFRMILANLEMILTNFENRVLATDIRHQQTVREQFDFNIILI